jgi:hypothetical protein
VADFSKFDEYKLFIEDTARLSERRFTISNSYLAANFSLILGIIGLLITSSLKDGTFSKWPLTIAILPLILAGIVVCILWHRQLNTYKTFIDFRIEQLEGMEKSEELECCHRMYTLEANRFYRKAPESLKIGYTRIEIQLPWLFLILYAIFGIGLLGVLGIRLLLWLV